MNDNNLDEKAMTDAEMAKREKIVKSMKKSAGDFRKRYGDRAKEVMYATATKQVMKEDQDVEQIDELSKKTLGSYIKKASSSSHPSSASNLASRAASKLASDEEDDGEKEDHKSFMRSKNISKAVDKLTKEGVAEETVDEATWKGHSDTVKNPNFNDELSNRRVNQVGKRLKSGKLSYAERGSQERLKSLMKFTQKKGGLAGPKGPLPEETIDEADTKPGWMLRKMRDSNDPTYQKIADKQAGMAALKHASSSKADRQSKAAEKRVMDWAKSSANEAYKIGDTVTPNMGLHKGQPHEVIHVHKDGSVNIKPKGIHPDRVEYKLGMAKARPDQLMQESIDTEYKEDKMGRKYKAHKEKEMDAEEENDEVEVTNADKKGKATTMKEELKGSQHKIDANKNKKIDAHDFKLLRNKYKKVAEEYMELDEQDRLAMRGLYSANPQEVPGYMAKTAKGKAQIAAKNKPILKDRIKSSLGKHTKPNLPEETYVLSDVYGAGVVLANEHAEPDADGIVDWYAVEFDHGKEKIFVEDLELMAAQYDALNKGE